MTEAGRSTQDPITLASQGNNSETRRDLLERYRGYLCRTVASRLDRRSASRLGPSDIVQESLAEAAGRMDDCLYDHAFTFFGELRPGDFVAARPRGPGVAVYSTR